MQAATRSTFSELAQKIERDRSLMEMRLDLEELRYRYSRVYHALASVVGKDKALAIAKGEIESRAARV